MITMVNDMDYKSTIRKHGIIIAICVICSVLIVAGTSYALFFQTNINTENQVLKTGKLEVTYGNESSRITLAKMLPVTDETGLHDNNYASVVKIENTGSLPASYSLKLSKDLEAITTQGKDSSNFIDLQYVKIAVFVGEELVIPTTSLNQLNSVDNVYELYNGTLDSESNAVITVRLWLDSSTPETESGKFIYFKLDVSSVVDESKTPEGSTTSNE